jgi:hypothetical protein
MRRTLEATFGRAATAILTLASFPGSFASSGTSNLPKSAGRKVVGLCAELVLKAGTDEASSSVSNTASFDPMKWRGPPFGLTGCASAFFKSGEFPTNSIELRPPVRINTPDDQATQKNSAEPLWLRNQIIITFKDEPLMLGGEAKHLSLTRPSPNMSMSRF